jgi:hypothetical protein
MTFALDLQRFAEKCADKADDAVANIVARVATELDKRSPVGDATYWISPPPKGYVGGHFRANWQLGVGSVPVGEKPGVTPALGTIIAEIPEEASGKVYWLANNVPYADRIEHGWSRQAPTGLVGLTATMFQQIVREAVEVLP